MCALISPANGSKGKHRDGGAGGELKGGGGHDRPANPLDCKHANRPNDVLQRRHAEVMKRHRQPIHYVITHRSRHYDLPGLGRLMDAGGDIDAISLENAVVVDDIFHIYANANSYRRRVRLTRLALKGPLDIDRPSYCVN